MKAIQEAISESRALYGTLKAISYKVEGTLSEQFMKHPRQQVQDAASPWVVAYAEAALAANEAEGGPAVLRALMRREAVGSGAVYLSSLLEGLAQWRKKPAPLDLVETQVRAVQDALRTVRAGEYQEELRERIAASPENAQRLNIVTDAMVNAFIEWQQKGTEDDITLQWGYRTQLLQDLRAANQVVQHACGNKETFGKALREHIPLARRIGERDETMVTMYEEFYGAPLPASVQTLALIGAGQKIIRLAERDAPRMAREAIGFPELLNSLGGDAKVPDKPETETDKVKNAFYQLRRFYEEASLLAGAAQATSRGRGVS